MNQPSFYYNQLSLRNFRGFKKVDSVPLAPLTFLVGPNSSGKSSLFDALLLVAQSRFTPGNPIATPSWLGPFVDLGSFNDTVFAHNTALNIKIGIEISIGRVVKKMHQRRRKPQIERHHIGFEFHIRAFGDEAAGRLSNLVVRDVLTGEEVRFKHKINKYHKVVVEFLGRKRIRKIEGGISPRRFSHWVLREIGLAREQQSKRLYNAKKMASWKRLQEVAGSYILTSVAAETERVSSGRAAPKRWYTETAVSINAPSYPLGPRVIDTIDPRMLEKYKSEYWWPYYSRKLPLTNETLESMLNKLNIAKKIRGSKLSPYHSAIEVVDNITNVKANIIDVGYGASQVIPVLYACLSPARGPLFVEQPEIHLHPRAQGTVAELLCRTSEHRQVVVETHSVHMINRARILIARGELDAKDVIINYIDRTSKGSCVHQIPILKNGDFGVKWPEGFFDERFQDTMALLQLKGKKKRKG